MFSLCFQMFKGQLENKV